MEVIDLADDGSYTTHLLYLPGSLACGDTPRQVLDSIIKPI